MIQLDISKTLQTVTGPMNMDVQLDIREGELITLYGESGAGKTSLLRILAGLMNPERGSIVVDGETWFDSRVQKNKPPQQRGIGFVFQDYALFPHMSIRQNLAYAQSKNQADSQIEELLEMTELTPLQHQKASQLSGGQKQRVALARALACSPKLLLLDEPLSALDHNMRSKIQDYLFRLRQHYGTTTLLVSHDPGEIIKLSDRVVALEQGKITHNTAPLPFFHSGNSSAKCTFKGEIMAIEKADVVYLITILVGLEVIKVVANVSEAMALDTGDKVLVSTKAFNPVIHKL